MSREIVGEYPYVIDLLRIIIGIVFGDFFILCYIPKGTIRNIVLRIGVGRGSDGLKGTAGGMVQELGA